MEFNLKDYIKLNTSKDSNNNYPQTHFCPTKEAFFKSVGSDFIKNANNITKKGNEFLVGLSHGQSPSGVYEYILEHYSELKNPEKIHYTFINSKLKRQRGLDGVIDAIGFIKELLITNKISKDQIIGRALDRDDLETYKVGLNKSLLKYLKKLNKKGLDYVFVASSPEGQIAGISRFSKAFESNEIVTIVKNYREFELTFTPSFLMKSSRIAFLATKAEKRRPLAWLFYKWGKENESPSFLRYIDDVENKMTVFIDDNALTWPQEIMFRETKYGKSCIKVDLSKPYNQKAKKKLPVILFIHGFIGLNTFDALLSIIPANSYIPAALHYGSIPHDLPIDRYSNFITKNIEHVVSHFGKKGHPVYIFDHSIANIYLMMIDKNIEDYPGIKKYLKGRIAANSFFGQESKKASITFIDNVIFKSKLSLVDKAIFRPVRLMTSVQPKKITRSLGIMFAKKIINSDVNVNGRIWGAVKKRILFLLDDMDSLPKLNKIPIEHTLNRLPLKIFIIQIYSALKESTKLDSVTQMSGFEKYNIPILVMKSDLDPIAKFVSSVYASSSNVDILDVTNNDEKKTVREHLFYMVNPLTTYKIIEHFVNDVQPALNKTKRVVAEVLV